MLLALYNGCVILLIGVLVFMEFYLVARKRGQVLLCMECQQCVSACPLLRKGCKPVDIMLAAKSGEHPAAVKEVGALCIRCGRCQAACPRGLAPYLEIEDSVPPEDAASGIEESKVPRIGMSRGD